MSLCFRCCNYLNWTEDGGRFDDCRRGCFPYRTSAVGVVECNNFNLCDSLDWEERIELQEMGYGTR